ncbi:hypothetical protein GOP47_0017028 [Adiantum capillus-veneris]|uniref:Uncharacterized protein n=1 Tax=Adiantum capillus-veneris TaxID=13818 RepID=A0A9D4UIT1_ADICA|nr:hypothetical protein GOP47_0017028 [Adiantum capillus-veneris]
MVPASTFSNTKRRCVQTLRFPMKHRRRQIHLLLEALQAIGKLPSASRLVSRQQGCLLCSKSVMLMIALGLLYVRVRFSIFLESTGFLALLKVEVPPASPAGR